MSTRSIDRSEASPQHPQDLVATLTKPSDGIVSRTLNRRISIPISRRLARTPITPNQISVGNLLVGFAAAAFAATGETSHLMISGILFQLGSILDGCDGEVAHLKRRASAKGAWIDTLTDNLTYVAYCIGVTIGLYRRVGSPYVLLAGAAATVSLIAALGLMYITLSKHTDSGSLLRFGDAAMKQARQGEASLLKRAIARVEFMIRRDFFALLFCILALLDRIDLIFWLLVAGSAGLLLSVLVSVRQVSHELRQ